MCETQSTEHYRLRAFRGRVLVSEHTGTYEVGMVTTMREALIFAGHSVTLSVWREFEVTL